MRVLAIPIFIGVICWILYVVAKPKTTSRTDD